MERSIYLINPRESMPGYNNMEVLEAWGVSRYVNLVDLTMPTVAAMVPPGWQISLCDERMNPVDFDTDAAIVGITGKVTQRDRMVELAAAFRERGKLVMIGGPYASLNPDDMRPHADILVRGEIEEIAAGMFAEIASGRFQSEYVGNKPDLRLSPQPRWDLYPKNRALTAQVQTSRGCPFECEFCDVIQYLGRKQRWKEPAQVVAELDVLYDIGYRYVFLADDNLTVVRRRARELLEALAAWNATRSNGRVRFSTQLSIDIARDEAMLELCVKAGLLNVYVGVETPNEESLAETKKRQNLRIDIVKEIEKFAHHGISVTAGLIVGFDHDGPDIFERQRDFVERLPVPLAHVGLLVAPAATPLRARMAAEGRLLGDDRLGAGNMLRTNIMPKNMSYDEMMDGMQWLLHAIFAPEAFLARMERFVALAPQILRRPDPLARPTPGQRKLYGRLARYGRSEERLVRRGWQLIQQYPKLRAELGYTLMAYCQIRYMLEAQGVWRPDLLGIERPPFLDAA